MEPLTPINLDEYRHSQALAKALEPIQTAIAQLNPQDADDALKLSRLYKEQAAVLKAMKSADRSERRAMIATDDLEATVEADIRAWLAQRDYHYTHADQTFWLWEPLQARWTPTSKSGLLIDNPDLIDTEMFAAFMRVMRADGRFYSRSVMTFGEPPPECLNRLRWDFLKPQEGEPHWFFDALIESFAGGRPENIDHVEKLIVAKWSNPANHLLPTLLISDTSGGSGKGLMGECLLPTIFGADLVCPNLSLDALTARFTSHLEGKAVWFVSESRADRNDEEALKRLLGSSSLIVERKGKEAYQSTNTALVIVASNFELGGVRLTGEKIDRRFSVIRVDRPLGSRLAERLSIPEDDADTWVRTEGSNILKDPEEVAKWLAALIARHGEITDLPGLHGADYHALVEAQRDTASEVFAAFITPDLTYFNRRLMFDCYVDQLRRNGGGKPWSNALFYARAEAWAAKRNLKIAAKVVNWRDGLKRSKATIYHLAATDPGSTVSANDDLYMDRDDFDRPYWKVDLP